MTSLQTAIRLSLEGPLHKALAAFRVLRQSDPDSRLAAAYEADVYARLGKYDQAVLLLEDMRNRGAWDSDLEKQLQAFEHARNDLRRVERTRFQDGGFLCKAIVPDGRGGYLVDTLGFPGTWRLTLPESRPAPPGAYLRFLKSMAWASEEAPEHAINSSKPVSGGTVRVHEEAEGVPLAVRLVESNHALFWMVEARYDVLEWERTRQRKALEKLITGGGLHVETKPSESVPSSIKVDFGAKPDVLLVSLGLASDYGVLILRDRLRHQGFEAAAGYVRSTARMESYVESWGGLRLSGNGAPHVFAVSVLDAIIPEVCHVIFRIRRKFPNAFVVIGGSTSQTPEQLASLVPDFDVLIKGDADEILGRVAEIIGRTDRSAGLSEAQVDALCGLPGGLIVQTGPHRIVHRLDHTNVPDRYHLPHPDGKRTIYYWQTSRGCPYDCRFCNKWSGKRYDLVTPWRKDYEALPASERSARAMVEFLLDRLATEWPEAPSQDALDRMLTDGKDGGKLPPELDLPEKIFIVIEDDDFLINRERIHAFCRLVEERGLQRFFTFSAITSVRTLHRGGHRIDTDLLQLLKQAGFGSLDIGSDGLCQSTIEENQKGYTLDRHVIPLNAYLQRNGFFAFNNTIITTPYSTLPQLIESVLYFCACPYPINVALEIGIMGHIGNKFTNEDIVNQQYDWRGQEGEDRGHFVLLDNYSVPAPYYEYALNGSHIISYSDPKVRELILQFPEKEPTDFIEDHFAEEDVLSVVEAWTQLPDDRAETRALGSSIALLRERRPLYDVRYAVATVREEMSMLNEVSFQSYYYKLERNAVHDDPLFKWINKRRWEAGWQKRAKDWDAAEKTLRIIIHRAPWYFRPHRELIVLLGNTGRLADAVEHFARYQLVDPNLRFYHMIFSQLLKALGLDKTIRKQRILFHIPRYYTISPIYYFLALAKDLAGADVRGFSFAPFTPDDIENLYELFDFLTIDTIKQTVSRAPGNTREVLASGREIMLCGVPVRLSDDGRKLHIDYGRIDPRGALTVRW